jgi:metal-responsive CopG/Arc/MetJ family transcriptional regulator
MAISDKNTRIQVTIPKDLHDKIKEIAEAENRSVSNYIVSLIKKAVEDN